MSLLGASIGLGVAQGALGFLGSRSAAQANAAAVRARNAAIETAANSTRSARKAQQKYAYRLQQGNVGSQANAVSGALAATSAARGIGGSRTAQALQQNNLGQAGERLEDLAVNDLLTRTQIDIDWANSMNQRGGYQGQSMGLSLLNAGLSAINTGLSAYGTLKAGGFGSSSPTQTTAWQGIPYRIPGR